MKKRIPALIAALTMLTSSAAAMPVTSVNAGSQLPSHVDLSETVYFPEIIYQQYNSCGSCAAGYYQFTYEARKLLRESDPNADIDFAFSPLAIYNNINGGKDEGNDIIDVYNFLKKNGAVCIGDYLYDDLSIGIDYPKRPDVILDENGELDFDLLDMDLLSSEVTVAYITKEQLDEYPKYQQKFFEYAGNGFYRRKGEYITRQEYEDIIRDDEEKEMDYLPTPDHELYLYRKDPLSELPNDERSLFEALKIRINKPSFINLSAYCKKDGDEMIKIEKDESEANVRNGIKEIKKKLYEGKVLTTQTDGCSEEYITNSATRNGDPLNEEVVYQNNCDNVSIPHYVTIVGYDDDIAYDINGDGVVDPEKEKGAFKIANSFGEGWGNDGFMWIMYDALYPESLVGVKAPEDFDDYEFGNYGNIELSRYAAFSDLIYIDAVKKDIKLVSEADVYTNNYYDVLIGNECNGESVLTDESNKGSYENTIEYNGVFVSDITEICGDNANNKTYRINIDNINSSGDTKVVVKSVCLKDDKGNVVAKKNFFSDSQIEARLKRLAPGNYFTNTLKVEFPLGDVNYDGVYDKKDYKIVKAYFNDPDNSDLSLFQKDLLDADNNGVVDNKDYKILKKTYKK